MIQQPFEGLCLEGFLYLIKISYTYLPLGASRATHIGTKVVERLFICNYIDPRIQMLNLGFTKVL